jgi:hypothetical protein
VFNPAWVVCILSTVAFHIFFLLSGDKDALRKPKPS